MPRCTLLTCLLLGAGGLLSGSPSSLAQNAPAPSAAWSFDNPENGKVVEHRSGDRVAVKTPYHPYEAVEGVVNQAFRSDGYSTWLDVSLPDEHQPREALTTEAWIALESYPVTNAPILNKYTFPDAGYFFGMDEWGQWYLSVSINGEWYTCWARTPDGEKDRFPREKWAHVAGTFDSSTGEMQVYLNGEVVGSTSVPSAPLTVDSETRTTLVRNVHSPTTAGMHTGHLNGAFDEVALYDEALSASQIQQRADRDLPPAQSALAVPDSRYEDDPHRPAFHAMPSANWTNEPHGLVHHDGTFHLFHQRNPNGPYFQRLRWGHLTSSNLTEWTEKPVALTPKPGSWESLGNWSGDAVVESDTVTPVYTGVDGQKAGIGIARRLDDDSFRKSPENPVIPSAPEGTRDFRDPYVFKEGDLWHALIGSGFQDEGGAALHYTSFDLKTWTYQGPAFEAPQSQAGIFWEMPVLMELGNGKYIFEITTVEEGAPARALYWIGTWDGKKFTPDHEEPRRLDLINHFLSPTIARDSQNRIVAMGIVDDTRPTESMKSAGWAHTFSLPRQWRLCNGDLCQTPAPQTKNLRGPHVERTDVELTPDGNDVLPGITGDQLEVKAVFEQGATGTYGIDLRASPTGVERTRVAYDAEAEELIVNLRSSTLSSTISNAELKRIPYQHPSDEPLTIHAFVDHSVLEVFIDEREVFSTRIYPTRSDSKGVDVFAEDQSVMLQSVDVWRLDSDKPFPDPTTGGGDSAIRLDPIAPNPIAGEAARITFRVSSSQRTTLSVYDILGREVATIFDRNVPAGEKTLRWPTRQDIASGLYFVRLNSGSTTRSRKLIVTP